MHIATDTPNVSTFDSTLGDFVILEIGSGPEKLRIVLTPNQALSASRALQTHALSITEEARKQAEVVPFARKRNAARA